MTGPTPNDWQVLAIRYATTQRPARDLSLDADFHDLPGTLDYYVWLVRGSRGVYLLDTGYEPGEGARRGRTLLRHPVEALARLGHPADGIEDVIISHLHYDHAGNLPAFPRARFHLQDREMAYGTGRCMCHARMRKPFSVEDVAQAVRMVFAGRVVFHDGDAVLAPGLSLHLIGGHSRGLQVVRVETPSGVVVLASDALHYTHYLADGDAFPLFSDYDDVLDGYDRLKALAGPGGIIVPGHDPAVLTLFPPLSPDQPEVLVLG